MAASLNKIINKLGPYFYKLAEKSQDVFWIRSANFQTQLYINSAYEKIWGRSCQSLYNHPSDWVNTVVIEDRDPLRQQIMEWQADPKPDDMRLTCYRIKNVHDQIRWIKSIGFSIHEGHQCIGYAGVAQDITHEKLRLNEVNEASRFFRFFVEKINGAFWIKDLTGEKQIYISPAYETIWGKSCESLYNDPQSWLNPILPEDLENNKVNLQCFEPGEHDPNKTCQFNFRITRPDGSIRWIKDIHFMIKDNDKPIGFAGIAEDITENVLRERELREAKETAEKANRAKSDFLAMMSHELRTPLNAILGMTQILRNSHLTEEQIGQTDVITQSGERLLALLNDLLDFAKLEVGKLSFVNDAFNLKLLVETLINDMHPQADTKGIQLKLKYTFDVPRMIMGDEKRIRQILVNLVSNAIKFTERGHVRIHVTCLQRNFKEVTLCFTVEDTGIGIEKSQLDTIFSRFQQINSVYQRKHDGVGLGLSIVKELVEKMGGSTAVSSQVGVGSQFSCIIPFQLRNFSVAGAGELSKDFSEPTHPIDLTEIYKNVTFDVNILVVEDNLINQKISKILLEQLGCHVDLANSAEAAIDKLHKAYDIIFMDIGLPGMDGFEAVKVIRAREAMVGQRVPIVAMTAHVFARDRQRCFEVGMDEVIAKPIMQDDLIAILQRWTSDKPSASGVSRKNRVTS